MSKICSQCNTVNRDSVIYCIKCHNRLQGGGAAGYQGGGAAGYQGGGTASYQGGGAASYQATGTYTQQPQQTTRTAAQTNVNYPKATNYNGEFDLVDPSEQVIDILNNSLAHGVVSGNGLTKRAIGFTNKRFYARIKTFKLRRGIVTEEFVVKNEDITGTSLEYHKPIIWIVLAVIALLTALIAMTESVPLGIVGIIVAAILVGIYWLKRGVFINISYAGNTSEFSVKSYKIERVKEFMKKLRSCI